MLEINDRSFAGNDLQAQDVPQKEFGDGFVITFKCPVR